MKPTIMLLLSLSLITACMDQEIKRENRFLNISNDSLTDLEQQILKEWTNFNNRADSIVCAAEASIETAREGLVTREVYNRGQLQRVIRKADYQLEELREHIATVEDYETATDIFNITVLNRLDSLKVEFIQRKETLDRYLLQLREYEYMPYE